MARRTRRVGKSRKGARKNLGKTVKRKVSRKRVRNPGGI